MATINGGGGDKPLPKEAPIKDINAQRSISFTSQTVTMGGVTYLAATDSMYGNELWRTDGTDGGTTLVKDINPGLDSSRIGLLTVVGNTLYFKADNGTNGRELWAF